MSLFPDIAPLVKEVQQLNQHQQKIIALLEEQNKILQQLIQK